MNTYSVKQISDLLETNPETVRRWIRDDKLKAVQVSRKDGNVITEAELQRFLKATPKYLPKFTAGITALSPLIGITAFAGGVIAGAVMGYLDEKKNTDVRIMPDDFKRYLEENISKLKKTAVQKRDLIRQTENEITAIEKQIDQYQYLLDHEEILNDAINTVAASEKAGKE